MWEVCGGVFRVSVYKTISSATKYTWPYSFPVCIPFISFACLIALIKALSIILNRMCRENILILFLILVKILCAFLWWGAVCRLLYTAFIMWGYICCIPGFSGIFMMKGCRILLQVFCASSEMILWFLSEKSDRRRGQESCSSSGVVSTEMRRQQHQLHVRHDLLSL